MKFRLLCLFALLLPELSLDPFKGLQSPSLWHPLGRDELGRDALLRLLHGGARSMGFASAVALLALFVALLLALAPPKGRGALSALRSVPPLLFLLPLAAAMGGLNSPSLGLLIGAFLALHCEIPLRSRLESFRRSGAWRMETVLGASPHNRILRWAPWGWDQMAALFPSAWLGALWAEATLSTLGLGPGPEHNSLGRILQEELPNLASDATPLSWAALILILALAWSSAVKSEERP